MQQDVAPAAKMSQSRSTGVKPRPTEILAKLTWTKSNHYFVADVSLSQG